MGAGPVDVEGFEPKRANELKLSMDGVSAFTVPTHASTRPPPPPASGVDNAPHRLRNHHSHNNHNNHNHSSHNNHHNHNSHSHSEEEEEEDDDDDDDDEEWWGGGEGVGVPDDVVHWKALDHTTNSAGRAPLKTQPPHHPQPHHHRPFHPHHPSSSPPHSLALDAITPLEWESPHLRMAVRDFQIKAQYSFWLDVTAKVAHHLPLALALTLTFPHTCPSPYPHTYLTLT